MAIYRYVLESEHFDFEYDRWKTDPNIIKNVESFADSLEKEYGASCEKFNTKLDEITEKSETAKTLDEGSKYYDAYVDTLEEYMKYLEKVYNEISEKAKNFKSKGIMDNETYDIIESNLRVYKVNAAILKSQMQFCRENKEFLFDYDAFEESVADKTEKSIKKFKAFIKKSHRTVKTAVAKTKSMFNSIISKFKSLSHKIKRKIK